MTVLWNLDRFEIDDDTLRKLRVTYPCLDKELPKMELWYLANPRKRKKNHYRFIINWLNKVARNDGKAAAPVRDYKRESREFEEKIRVARAEAAPPPDEWRELMAKLKRKDIHDTP